MVEIAEGKAAGPQCVVGLIEGQLEPRGGEGLHGEQDKSAARRERDEPLRAPGGSGPRSGDDGSLRHVVAFSREPLFASPVPSRMQVSQGSIAHA